MWLLPGMTLVVTLFLSFKLFISSYFLNCSTYLHHLTIPSFKLKKTAEKYLKIVSGKHHYMTTI